MLPSPNSSAAAGPPEILRTLPELRMIETETKTAIGETALPSHSFHRIRFYKNFYLDLESVCDYTPKSPSPASLKQYPCLVSP